MTWMTDLQDHIAANGLGTVPGDLFVGVMDDIGDAVTVGLGRYKGATRETMDDGGVAIEIPMLQVAVRGKSYEASELRMEGIRNLLKVVKGVTIGTTHFLRITPDGTIKDIGRDTAGRQMFTQDFEVWM